MTRAATLWGAGAIGSIAVHAAAISLLLPSLTPEPAPNQPRPQSAVFMDRLEAPQATAEAQNPESSETPATDPSVPTLREGAIPQSKANAVTPKPLLQRAQTIETAALAEVSGAQIKTSAIEPAAQPAIAALAPLGQSAIASQPADIVAASVSLTAPQAAAIATGGIPAALAPSTGENTPSSPATGETTPQAELPSIAAKAALAWQFGDRLVTDPQAVATVQAFMAPTALATSRANAGQVKDDMSAVLASFECTRLSAAFSTQKGALELRGHIPDPALQEQILTAMQAQVGDGIPVTASLLHLPAPQCQALGAIDQIGLPQSTDQFTNPLLIGEALHARAYTYSDGQRLAFDLTAPDYDAYVYVDYFAADGTVIHLAPNTVITLQKHIAKSQVGVGKDKTGTPGLKITIGPPYGQEIAAAFASSHPLYEGLRPISEPAGPYLSFMKEQVERARETHSDFKGEWVYFFITTEPATQ